MDTPLVCVLYKCVTSQIANDSFSPFRVEVNVTVGDRKANEYEKQNMERPGFCKSCITMN